MIPRPRTLPMLLMLLLLTGVSAFAQDNGADPIIGLTEPRMLSFDAEGNLYVAEAGRGGDVSAQRRQGVDAMVGGTSRITIVSPEGEKSVLIAALSSMDTPAPGPLPPGQRNVFGATSAVPTEDALWVTIGEGPSGNPTTTLLSEVALKLDPRTLHIEQLIDVGAYERRNNPDEGIVASNPSDIAIGEDGTAYIVDASCNCLLTWTEDAGLQLFNVWKEDPEPVPNSIDFGPEGDLYVGFFSGAPFRPGSARVERWTTGGELVESFGGLTMVVDVLVDDDGTIYAVEFAEGVSEEQGIIPNSGRVVRVGDDGVTPVAAGLNFPYGMARSPDGSLIVANNAAFVEPGAGEIVEIADP